MAIFVNINKAKNVWKEKIRTARKPVLEKLDIDFMKAQEAGTSTTSIVADKNVLRDLTSQVDTATTETEIKTVWNDMLGDR